MIVISTRTTDTAAAARAGAHPSRMPQTPAGHGRGIVTVTFAILVAAALLTWPGATLAQSAADQPVRADDPMATDEPDQTAPEEAARPPGEVESPAAEREGDEPVTEEEATEEATPAQPNSAQRNPAADRDDDDETIGEEPAASVDSATSHDSAVGRKKVAKKHAQPTPPPSHLGLCDPRPNRNQLVPPCMTPEMYEKLRHDPAWLAKKERYRAHLLYIPPACSMPGEQKAVECSPDLTAEQVAAAKKRGEEQILAAYQTCRRNCSNFYATCYDRSFCSKKRQECADVCDAERAELESSQRSYDKYLDSRVERQ